VVVIMWIQPFKVNANERTHWITLEQEEDKPLFIIEHYDPPVGNSLHSFPSDIRKDEDTSELELKFVYRILVKTCEGLFVISVAKNLPLIRYFLEP
jgi:hypothetical protein